MKYYDYQKGKLALAYELEKSNYRNEYIHTLSAYWNNNTTGIMSLYNKRKTPNIYQFFESLELVDRRFFKTGNLFEEWGNIIREFDKKIKEYERKTKSSYN